MSEDHIMTSDRALAMILEAVTRAIGNAKRPDTVEARYETLKYMRDAWIDSRYFSFEGKLLITTAQKEIERLRGLLPHAYNEIRSVS